MRNKYRGADGGQVSVEQVAHELTVAIDPLDMERSPHALTAFALTMASSALVKVEEVLGPAREGEQPDATTLRSELAAGVEELRLALHGLNGIYEAADELIMSWTSGAGLAARDSGADVGIEPVEPAWTAEEGEYTELDIEADELPERGIAPDPRKYTWKETRGRISELSWVDPIPRLSEADLFDPDVQSRLDTPMEEALILPEHMRGEREYYLARMRACGVQTVRDAFVMDEKVFRIYGLGPIHDYIRGVLRRTCPEIPAIPPTAPRGALVAQYCRSLAQIPAQVFPSYRGDRFTEGFKRRVTVMDMIDPDTGEPAQARFLTDDFLRLRRLGIPNWYNEETSNAVRKFIQDFTRARRELYGEE